MCVCSYSVVCVGVHMSACTYVIAFMCPHVSIRVCVFVGVCLYVVGYGCPRVYVIVPVRHCSKALICECVRFVFNVFAFCCM